MRALLATALVPFSFTAARAAATPDIRFFRIGTGATSGTYFPLGRELANILSNPPGGSDCAHGGSCGVPGVIAVAETSQGSVENVQSVARGAFDSALCQADVAAAAYAGTSSFDKQGPLRSLRALANLYSESVHIVVRADSAIKSIKDLKGKRVSLGEPESGTRVDAGLILNAAGLAEKDLKPNFSKLALACDNLRDGSIDGFFQTAGCPVPAIADLAASIPLRLLPIPDDTIGKLRKKYGFFTQDKIPAGTYPGIDDEIATAGIGAEWITTASLEDEFAYLLVKALWSASSQRALSGGHPIGKRIRLAQALDGLALPLHPGAERFYRQAGLMLDTAARPD